MTDANLMDAKCTHGNYWDECKECEWPKDLEFQEDEVEPVD